MARKTNGPPIILFSLLFCKSHIVRQHYRYVAYQSPFRGDASPTLSHKEWLKNRRARFPASQRPCYWGLENLGKVYPLVAQAAMPSKALLKLFSKLNLFHALCTLRNSHRKYIHLNLRFIQEAILTTEK